MNKRLIVSITSSLTFGIILLLIMINTTNINFHLFWKISFIIKYILIGFIIGISKLKISWWLHGILIGIVLALPNALLQLTSGDQQIRFFLDALITAAVCGFFVELITSVVFKAKNID